MEKWVKWGSESLTFDHQSAYFYILAVYFKT